MGAILTLWNAIRTALAALNIDRKKQNKIQ